MNSNRKFICLFNRPYSLSHLSIIVWFLFIISLAHNNDAVANLIPNGDFENISRDFALQWSKLWTRESDSGTLVIERENPPEDS